MALIQKTKNHITIPEYILQIKRCNNLPSLEHKLINLAYWAPIEALCQYFKEFSKVCIHYLSHLMHVQNYQPMTKYLVNLLQQKSYKTNKICSQQFSYILAKIKAKIKNIKLVNNFKFNHQLQPLAFRLNTHISQKQGAEADNCWQSLNQTNKIQQLIEKIMTEQTKLPNPNCMGCSQFYYEQNIQNINQFCTVVGFIDNSTFFQDLRRHICATLNNGGGYILINDDFTPILRGLESSPQLKNYIYQTIESCMKTIQPANQFYYYKINLLQLIQNPYKLLSPIPLQKNQTFASKFVVKIALQANKFNVFYIQQSLKANKIVYNFFVKKKDQISRVVEENIYLTILKIHKLNRRKYVRKKIKCPTCIKLSEKYKQIIDKIQTFTQQNQDLPIFRYKYSTLLGISSLKYQSDFMKNFQVQVRKKNSYVILSKPFTKFCVNVLRQFWVISHACEFEELSKMVKKADVDFKTRIISITKYIQIKGSQKEVKIKRMEAAFKQSRLQKEEQYSSKEVLFTYLQFSSLQQAIFAYINLDNISVRCEFVKEHHVKNEHKKKN